jgi:DNA-damage-inducible protein J
MKARNDVQVTMRIDRNVKEAAEQLFSRLGLNMTTAVGLFLRKAISEDAIPFVVSAKKSGITGINGYSARQIEELFGVAVDDAIAKKKQNGSPVARYDEENKKAYLEYADGRREYVND